MASSLAHASRTELVHLAQRAKAQVANIKKKTEEGVEAALQTGETVGAAALTGYLRGRFGTQEEDSMTLFGVDAELLAGGAGLALAMVMGGESAKHIHAASNGVLAAWVALKTADIGATAAKEAA
jgi:hypothetical protein